MVRIFESESACRRFDTEVLRRVGALDSDKDGSQRLEMLLDNQLEGEAESGVMTRIADSPRLAKLSGPPALFGGAAVTVTVPSLIRHDPARRADSDLTVTGDHNIMMMT